MTTRKPYPSDVSGEEWALVAPYLTLLPEQCGQREHSLREVFNGLRYVVKTGAPWRWLAAGCFEALAEDLRTLLRLAAGRPAQPSAAILDSRTLRSTPESGERAGYDGAKRGFVLLPRRWVVERSFAWATRFRRLVKDYERYASTLADLHLVAFTCIMLRQPALLAAVP